MELADALVLQRKTNKAEMEIDRAIYGKKDKFQEDMAKAKVEDDARFMAWRKGRKHATVKGMSRADRKLLKAMRISGQTFEFEVKAKPAFKRPDAADTVVGKHINYDEMKVPAGLPDDVARHYNGLLHRRRSLKRAVLVGTLPDVFGRSFSRGEIPAILKDINPPMADFLPANFYPPAISASMTAEEKVKARQRLALFRRAWREGQELRHGLFSSRAKLVKHPNNRFWLVYDGQKTYVVQHAKYYYTDDDGQTKEGQRIEIRLRHNIRPTEFTLKALEAKYL